MKQLALKPIARSRLACMMACVAILAFVAFTKHKMDEATLESAAKRHKAATDLQALEARFRQNPDRSDLLKRIEIAALSSYSFERTYALSVLGDLGPHAAPALPTIAEGLRSSDPYVRDAAAHALADLGPLAAPAKKELILVLRQHVNESVAPYAAEALGNIGEGTGDVLSVLDFAARAKDSLASEPAKAAYRKLTNKDI